VAALSPAAHATIRAVFRVESAKVVARVTRMVRDVGLAEELAQDALVTALEQWPVSGIPDNPGAWLMAVAKKRALNVLARRKMLERKHGELAHELEEEQGRSGAELDAAMDDDIGDDLLRLVFTACHPVLSIEARVALTLRLLGGLTTEEIARAFLVPEATVAQRIVRAKSTLAGKGIPYEVPAREELGPRLASVLTVVYLVFNEGYSATAGDDYMRPALCEDALRLGRTLAGVLPGEPEVHGLLALMALTAARASARTGPTGEPVLLGDQDRSLWDRDRIEEGLAALARAGELAGAPGPYALQASIAACHARARTMAETDWSRIASLYGELDAITPSPVIALNRAVAVGMAAGPAAGLALLEPLASEPSMRHYHRLPAARADLLEKLGRLDEARAEFERAASLAQNTREKETLLGRASACARGKA
jgi:RNA polymerase sigma factor (sigma-70 family)